MSANRHLVTVDAFIQTILNVTGSTEVTCGDASLPFSDGMAAVALQQVLGRTVHTPLETAVAETAEWFLGAIVEGCPLPPPA